MVLMNYYSCPVDDKLISRFRGSWSDTGVYETQVYAYMKTFRFTGSPALYIECDVRMCHGRCPVSSHLFNVNFLWQLLNLFVRSSLQIVFCDNWCVDYLNIDREPWKTSRKKPKKKQENRRKNNNRWTFICIIMLSNSGDQSNDKVSTLIFSSGKTYHTGKHDVRGHATKQSI